METLGGFPILPATGLVGQSPPEAHANRRTPTSALRASVARSASGSLCDQQSWSRAPSRLAGARARTLAALAYAASESSLSRPRAELAFATGTALVQAGAPSTTPSEVGPCTESDGAQGEEHVPTVGVRSCSSRPRPDAKRRPRATRARIARPKSLVRRVGHVLPPLQPSARRDRAPLSRMGRCTLATGAGFRGIHLIELGPRRSAKVGEFATRVTRRPLVRGCHDEGS